jgi:Stress responsive A/B Barrel Domain
VITHVVAMTFQDKGNREEAKRRLEELPAQIENIRSMVVGLDVVGDPMGADLVLITTHEDVADLKTYQGHPVHQEFGGWLRPLLASRVVVDYES